MGKLFDSFYNCLNFKICQVKSLKLTICTLIVLLFAFFSCVYFIWAVTYSNTPSKVTYRDAHRTVYCTALFQKVYHSIFSTQVCSSNADLPLVASIMLAEDSFAVIYSEPSFKGNNAVISADMNVLPFAPKSIQILDRYCSYVSRDCTDNLEMHAICRREQHFNTLDLENHTVITGEKAVLAQTETRNLLINPFTHQNCLSEPSKAMMLIRVDPIKEGCVRFYEHIYFRGYSLETCESINWIGELRNDDVSSVLVAQNTYTELYQHIDFGGEMHSFSESHLDFTKFGFNDTMSSLIVEKANCVLFFQECGFKGDKMHVCRDEIIAPQFRNKISAVKTFSKGITIFDEVYAGNQIRIEANSSLACLQSVNFDEKTVSVRIDK